MKMTTLAVPIAAISICSAAIELVEPTSWQELYQLNEEEANTPRIELMKYKPQEISGEYLGVCQLRFPDLPKGEKFRITFLNRKKREFSSYVFVKQDDGGFVAEDPAIHDPCRFGLLNWDGGQLLYINLKELSSGKEYHYSCSPYTINQCCGEIGFHMNPLDEENKEFICALVGFKPYEEVSLKINTDPKIKLTASEMGEIVFYLDEKGDSQGGEGSLVVTHQRDSLIEMHFSYLWGKKLPQNEKVMTYKDSEFRQLVQ